MDSIPVVVPVVVVVVALLQLYVDNSAQKLVQS